MSTLKLRHFLQNQLSITDNNYVKISTSDIKVNDEIVQVLLNRYKKLFLEYEAVTNENIANIPPYVKDLGIDGNFDDDSITLNNLPPQLESLFIGSESREFNKPLENLPPGLKYLYIYSKYEHNLDNLPSSLIKLSIIGSFNKPLDNLPSSLKILNLNTYLSNDIIYSQKLDNLPHGLNILQISSIHKETGKYDHLKTKHSKFSIIYKTLDFLTDDY